MLLYYLTLFLLSSICSGSYILHFSDVHLDLGISQIRAFMHRVSRRSVLEVLVPVLRLLSSNQHSLHSLWYRFFFSSVISRFRVRLQVRQSDVRRSQASAGWDPELGPEQDSARPKLLYRSDSLHWRQRWQPRHLLESLPVLCPPACPGRPAAGDLS